jgi:type II secretory pathway pseudopilin PulG
VGLGFQGSGGPTVDHTVVAQINAPSYILGRLGLNPRPTNFSTMNDPQTSYLSLLYEKKEIPSLSYSYSAGAKYRNNGVLGTLTLGGYKEGISEVNDLNFQFYFDQSRDLTVGIQSITSSMGSKKTPLLPSGILSFIDSTVTQIWLPKESCDLFASTFGLKYDNNTNLYFLDGTQHAKLVAAKPSITFTIGLTAESGKTADITFPYAAFDLNITYPTVSTSTYYFPIRRAINETQFTLGRTFLQEAYLTVDYLRNNFSVSQRTWDTNQQTQIVPIPGLSNDTETSSNNGTSPSDGAGSNKNSTKKAGISTGAIAGIAIAAVVMIAAAIGLFVFLCIRKRRAAAREEMIATAAAAAALQEDKDRRDQPQENGVTEIFSPPIKPPELQGDYYDGHEAPGDEAHLRGELPAAAVHRRGELASHDIIPDTDVDGQSTVDLRPQHSASNLHEIYELEAPHGMVEMSNVRPTRDDHRSGETSSPVSAFSTPVSASSSVSRISRKPVSSPGRDPRRSPRRGGRERTPPPPLPKDYI